MGLLADQRGVVCREITCCSRVFWLELRSSPACYTLLCASTIFYTLYILYVFLAASRCWRCWSDAGDEDDEDDVVGLQSIINFTATMNSFSIFPQFSSIFFFRYNVLGFYTLLYFVATSLFYVDFSSLFLLFGLFLKSIYMTICMFAYIFYVQF